ncbi:MAG: YkgJ family cysteine cluster protein [Desulfobacterales bacterium]|nr:YkgJ family cysteine cluster protein [Desulfobacterales bacterium]
MSDSNNDEMIPVDLNDPMGFNCGPGNACFNECCRDLNQALTPYDILRMKNALGVSSAEFLREYTSLHYGPESGLPVITFKPNPATGHACPLVSEAGCTVYQDRPASCRLYPLARAIAMDRATGNIREFYAMIEEDHCKGHDPKHKLTVGKWLDGQDVAEHNRQNDKLMQLISLKNQIRPGKLEGVESDQFYMALYDLDTFRQEIQAQGLLDDLNIPDALMKKLESDDFALLDFGIAWVKYRLFGKDLEVDI